MNLLVRSGYIDQLKVSTERGFILGLVGEFLGKIIKGARGKFSFKNLLSEQFYSFLSLIFYLTFYSKPPHLETQV